MTTESTVFSEKVPHRVARNTVINILGRTANMVATLALSICIVRVLGEAAYGQYASVWALILILGVVASMGTDTIVVRESAKDLARAPELVSNTITLRLVLAGLAYTIAIIAALLMKTDPAFVRYVAIAGLALFASWYLLIATYFEATLRIGTRTLITVGATYLTLALTLVILLLQGGLDIILWGAVFVAFVTLIVAYAFVCRHFRPTLGRNIAVMKEILSASWPLAGVMFVVMLVTRIDQLMLLKMKGASVAGYYAASTRIAESVAVVPHAFMLSIFPLMSFYHSRDPARFGDVYSKSLKYVSVIVLPLALLLSFYPKPILRLCYGQHFVQGAPALAILAWRVFFVFIGSVNSGAIIVENRQRIFLFLGSILVPPFIAVNFLLISRYGLTGAAAAAVLHQIVSYLVLLFIPSMRKYTLAPAIAAFRPILAVGCAAAVMYWLRTPAGSALALALYAIVLAATRVFDKEDRDLVLRVIWKL